MPQRGCWPSWREPLALFPWRPLSTCLTSPATLCPSTSTSPPSTNWRFFSEGDVCLTFSYLYLFKVTLFNSNYISVFFENNRGKWCFSKIIFHFLSLHLRRSGRLERVGQYFVPDLWSLNRRDSSRQDVDRDVNCLKLGDKNKLSHPRLEQIIIQTFPAMVLYWIFHMWPGQSLRSFPMRVKRTETTRACMFY